VTRVFTALGESFVKRRGEKKEWDINLEKLIRWLRETGPTGGQQRKKSKSIYAFAHNAGKGEV